MEIKREKSDLGNFYNFELSNEDNKLEIFFGGNLDLYLTLKTNELIPEDGNPTVDFPITKENYSIYQLFDKLYNSIINIDFTQEDCRTDSSYRILVGEDKSIQWISDECPEKIEDYLTITKGEDRYDLSFTRVNTNEKLKSGYMIPIRICNSGSRCDPFNIPFMQLFNSLQKEDIEYHQITIDEYLYQKEQEKKKELTMH